MNEVKAGSMGQLLKFSSENAIRSSLEQILSNCMKTTMQKVLSPIEAKSPFESFEPVMI